MAWLFINFFNKLWGILDAKEKDEIEIVLDVETTGLDYTKEKNH